MLSPFRVFKGLTCKRERRDEKMPTERFYNLPVVKKKTICDAAVEEFTRVPFEKASINKIIQAAGISRGSFYTYFEDKRDVLRYIFEDATENFQNSWVEYAEKNNGDLWKTAEMFLQYSIANAKDNVLQLVKNIADSETMFGATHQLCNENSKSQQELQELMYRAIDTSDFKTKKKIFIIVGAVVIVAAVAGLILPRVLKGKQEEIVAEVPPAVTVEKPETRTIELSNELIGTIEPDSIVHVTPLGAGEITSVGVKTGDLVSAGQLLCVIDTKQVESSRITSETARITYEDAKKNLDRYSVLYAAGDVAEADYQSLADKVEMARLQYENAKIAYKIQMESSQVTAPIAGRVESFNISVHDMVSPQTTLCVISGEGGKSLTFYVSERIVGGLKIGDSIRVEKNGTEHSAAITEVSTMIDQASGLFKVKASIPDGDTLATGTSVKLYVIAQRAENVLTVPVDSIYYEGGNPYIYTYADGSLKKNAVTVGLSDNEYSEIPSGITADDQVVTTWTSELYEGSKVTLAGGNEKESQAEEDTTEETGTEPSGQTQ